MLTRALDWILGREPVATATGLAGVVAATVGVLAAWDIWNPTPEQVAAIGALVTALAGWLARKAVSPVTSTEERQVARSLRNMNTNLDAADDAGSVPLALIILLGLAVLLMAGLAVCSDALFEDEDEVDDLGQPRIVLISHDRDCEWEGDCGGQSYDQWRNEDRNRNRNRNRGAFSPGPFEDSPVDAFNGNTICLPGSTCTPDDRRDEPPPDERMRPMSLFPPTPDAIRQFVLSTIQAGIELGRLFADTTITFVSNLLVGIA